MSCPKCKPVCKCFDALDPTWKHSHECEWLISRLPGISVQLYQAETFKEWLRLGLKVFRLPSGFSVPTPWDTEKVHPASVNEGERHPFYKAFKSVYLPLAGKRQWQWDPSNPSFLTEDQLDDKDP